MLFLTQLAAPPQGRQLIGGGPEFTLAAQQPASHLMIGLFDFDQLPLQLLSLLLEFTDASFHRQALTPVTLNLLLQIRLTQMFVLNGGHVTSNFLPQTTDRGLRVVKCFAQSLSFVVQLAGLPIGRIQFGLHHRRLFLQHLELFFLLPQTIGIDPPIDQSDLSAELSQPLGEFPVSLGLGGLTADTAQPTFNLFDDICESRADSVRRVPAAVGFPVSWL